MPQLQSEGGVMDPKAKQLLDVFIRNAHKGKPGSLDMRRFLDFTIAVHRENLEVSSEEVLDLAMQTDFPEHIAVRLTYVFTYGVELLKRYDEVRR